MKKRTKPQKEKSWQILTHYYWELLRRNPDYQADFQAFQEKRITLTEMLSKWRTCISPEQPKNPDLVLGDVIKIHGPTDQVNRWLFNINLNYPNEIILEYLELLLKDLRKKLGLKRRIQWDSLDECLKIYDLRESGKTVEEIDDELYPDAIADTGIRKVNRLLNRAHRMIRTLQLL